MRCIFCKISSRNSQSVEHIIPESLGNKDHILANGVVCDKCNQYFSLKIEKIVLEKPYFISVRHRNYIESKKKKIPLERAFIGDDPNVFIDLNHGEPGICIENSATIDKIINKKVGRMMVPIYEEPDTKDKDISRFLGKVAIEVLAYKFYPNEEWLNEIIDKQELDELRQYVRIGDKPQFWEYHQRRLYSEQDEFHNPIISSEPYEILHEFTLIYTKELELYLILGIMGIEYAINFTNPKIEGYISWLEENKNVSPLFDPSERRIINKPNNIWKVGDNMNFIKK